MTVPTALSVRVLHEREDDFERGLVDMVADPLQALAGDGRFETFVGEDEFFVFFDAAPADFAARLAESEAAAPLREFLDRTTTFDPTIPDRSIVKDVHHVLEGPDKRHAEGEGNM